MFKPKYTITDRLLANIKRINTLVGQLNSRRFPNVILMELERAAREVSTYASVSIEGNPLPLTEVKKILKAKPEHIRESEQEVLNYNQALVWLNDQIDQGGPELSLNLILKVQKTVMGNLLPHQSGKLREEPVIVRNPRTGETAYLPPDAKDVRPLLKALIVFVSSAKDRIDPLILAGIFHKQMVIIHPFLDGNGRTTRLVTKVLLAQMGLNTFKLFSFENYYNQNVTRYFQTVGEYGNFYELTDKIDFTKWLTYFTEGLIDELLRVQKIFPQISTTPATGLQIHHLKILEHIREKGFITNKDYARLTDRAKATRILDFQKLIYLDLIERKGKGRATYYILKEK